MKNRTIVAVAGAAVVTAGVVLVVVANRAGRAPAVAVNPAEAGSPPAAADPRPRSDAGPPTVDPAPAERSPASPALPRAESVAPLRGSDAGGGVPSPTPAAGDAGQLPGASPAPLPPTDVARPKKKTRPPGTTPRPAAGGGGVASDAEPVIPLPDARVALAGVGDDTFSEAVWVRAINDPALAAGARKDLIEDLNEDGFDDPKNVTLDDLPLILSRIALIDELSPEAMDDSNAEAFAEARKDLVKMAARLMQPQER